MKKLEIISVGNGSPDFPGNFTKLEKELIRFYLKNGQTLHLFSGNSDIGDKRIDLYSKKATLNCDVFEYIDYQLEKETDYNRFSNVVINAPYNKRFADKYNKFFNKEEDKQFIIFASVQKTTKLWDFLSDNLKPERIILKSWHYYIPREYKFTKGFLCYAGGYRKPTILLILDHV